MDYSLIWARNWRFFGMFVSRSLLPLENDELTKEIRGMITKEDNQESDDYMEDWFQKVTTPQQYSIFQQILAPNPNVHLVSHIPVDIEV